jgi:hypothetical protein
LVFSVEKAIIPLAILVIGCMLFCMKQLSFDWGTWQPLSAVRALEAYARWLAEVATSRFGRTL